MPRLHGFWRAAIGTIAGCLYAFCTPTFSDAIWETVYRGVGGPDKPSITSWQLKVAGTAADNMPCIVLAFCVYGMLGLVRRKQPSEQYETRCRKCGYILRGIPEPRCSECGERI